MFSVFSDSPNNLKRSRGEDQSHHCPSPKRPRRESFSPERLEQFFTTFQTKKDIIGTEGVVKLCEALGIGVMDAAKMGSFTRDEFVSGMTKLSIDSPAKLRERLSELRDQALHNLDEIYVFSFHFLKDNASQRLIGLDGALSTMQILLAHLPHTDSFIDFMTNHQTAYKAMNLDQWTMFLTFNKVINVDFDEYDTDSAWPVMIDDFVTYMRGKKEKPNLLLHPNFPTFQQPQRCFQQVQQQHHPQQYQRWWVSQFGTGYPNNIPSEAGESTDVEMADL